MDKKFAKYMTYGKKVKSSWTENEFKLVEDMDKNKDFVKAVSLDNLNRYMLLKAWVSNWDANLCGFRDRFVGNIEECRIEKESYVEELKISDIEPIDKIRFITPDYETKFEVLNLTNVLVNGKSKKVAYIDECHFAFVGDSCFHICEYAEICERNGLEVELI